MKTMYKTLLLIFFIPLAVLASDNRGKYTKNKVIKKQYTVNKDATLNISNKYGNVSIVTNNSNNIEIQVTITTSGNNEEKVIDRLNEIDVDFSGSSSEVSAKTVIEKNSSSWSSWGRKNNNVNMEINYIVKMPVSNNLNVSVDYGGINLDKLEGVARIVCDYGKLDIGDLLNTNNKINADYTNKSNIEYMKNGDINADYSTIHIEKSGSVSLNADYSHMSFGMVSDINYNCDYGDLKINSANSVSGNSDYMHSTIGKLFSNGVFDMDYGSLKVNSLGEGFKDLNINSSYTNIKLGVNSSNSFTIKAKLSYGNLKNTSEFTFNKEIIKTTSKYYEGFYNKPNSSSIVNIDSQYGSVTFTNN